MVKKDEQEQEIEEITPEGEIEALEEETVIPNENPTQEIKTPVASATEAIEDIDTQVSGRYVPYKQEASEGILDRETNVLVGDNIYVILAKLLNDVEEIKKATG